MRSCLAAEFETKQGSTGRAGPAPSIWVPTAYRIWRELCARQGKVNSGARDQAEFGRPADRAPGLSDPNRDHQEESDATKHGNQQKVHTQ